MGSSDLKRGLLALGIGVSKKVADKLVQELGGTVHFTAHDLASFTQRVGDGKIRVHSSAKHAKASAGNNSATGGQYSSRDELSVSEQKDKVSFSPHDGEVEGRALDLDIATPQQDGREDGATCSGGLGCADDDAVLPLALDTRSRPQDHPTKFPWDDLPCWAREASKNALRELMGHHQR